MSNPVMYEYFVLPISLAGGLNHAMFDYGVVLYEKTPYDDCEIICGLIKALAAGTYTGMHLWKTYRMVGTDTAYVWYVGTVYHPLPSSDKERIAVSFDMEEAAKNAVIMAVNKNEFPHYSPNALVAALQLASGEGSKTLSNVTKVLTI